MCNYMFMRIQQLLTDQLETENDILLDDKVH